MTSRYSELTCPECSSNKFEFPKSAAEMVKCDDCGHEVAPLAALSHILGRAPAESRSERVKRHAAEVAESHARLRASVAETDRLIVASDEMLKRHRRESEEAED